MQHASMYQTVLHKPHLDLCLTEKIAGVMGDLRGICQFVVVQGEKRQGKVERKFSIAEVGVVKWSEDHWTVELEM